jgi:heme/copper-type cytochrome/quinol oxidase subunit 2
MNKYLSLVVFSVLLLLSGYVYQQFYRPASVGGFQSSGRQVEINMRVVQNTWRWQVDTIQISHNGEKGHLQTFPPIAEQATIRIQPGDKVKLHVYNEDTYDHGFAIDVFGVNRRLFPKSTTTIEFTPSLSGKFNFYCSVPCGQGHYDQVGTLIVGNGENARVMLSMEPNDSFLCYEFKNQGVAFR